jgi:hypothetical protein
MSLIIATKNFASGLSCSRKLQEMTQSNYPSVAFSKPRRRRCSDGSSRGVSQPSSLLLLTIRHIRLYALPFKVYLRDTDLAKLVTEDSACLDTFQRQPLDATHSGMNKFDSPKNPNFAQVKEAIRQFADNASSVLSRRKNCKFAALLWSSNYSST